MTAAIAPTPHDQVRPDVPRLRTSRRRDTTRPTPPVRSIDCFSGPFTMLREYGPGCPSADRRYPALTDDADLPNTTIVFEEAEGTPVEFAASGLRLSQHYGGRFADLVQRPEAAVAVAITETRTTISSHAEHARRPAGTDGGTTRLRRLRHRSFLRRPVVSTRLSRTGAAPPQTAQLVAGQIRHEWLSTVSVNRLSGRDIGSSELILGVRTAESELRLGVTVTNSEADNIARCIIRLATETKVPGRVRLTALEIDQIRRQTNRLVHLGGTVDLPASRTVPG